MDPSPQIKAAPPPKGNGRQRLFSNEIRKGNGTERSGASKDGNFGRGGCGRMMMENGGEPTPLTLLSKKSPNLFIPCTSSRVRGDNARRVGLLSGRWGKRGRRSWEDILSEQAVCALQSGAARTTPPPEWRQRDTPHKPGKLSRSRRWRRRRRRRQSSLAQSIKNGQFPASLPKIGAGRAIGRDQTYQ